MEHDKLNCFYDFLFNLKNIKRRGWLLRGVDENKCESISSHIFSMTWLAMSYINFYPELNETKVIKMCLLHDLGESIIGDITPVDGISPEDKFLKEHKAIKDIFSIYPETEHGKDWIELWEEFEAKETAESIYVNDMDKLDLLMQAIRYNKELGNSAFEFINSALESIKNKKIMDIAQTIYHDFKYSL